TNVTVSANRASALNNTDGYDDGGGVTVFAETRTAEIILENTVICDNKGDRYPELLVQGEGESAVTLNSFVKGENFGGGSNLPGSTSTATMFASPLTADEAPTYNGMNGSYQLHSESPLIDKGHSALLSIAKDLAGAARIFGSSIDIGAYEYQGVPRPANDLVSEADANTVWTYRTTLYVKIGAKTTLSIYSINGTLVRQAAVIGEGEYQYELPRGYYIVKLGDTTKKALIN
ncbi:MAG: hypothetical protein LBS80_03030, partial [Tannerella sp.]|nr:hypothetical protein [Tannerella sp.]